MKLPKNIEQQIDKAIIVLNKSGSFAQIVEVPIMPEIDLSVARQCPDDLPNSRSQCLYIRLKNLNGKYYRYEDTYKEIKRQFPDALG